LPYKIDIIKHGGFKFLTNLLIRRVGVVVGILIVLGISLIVGNRTMNINVLGSSNSSEIKQKIIDYGIEIGKVNKFNIQELEKYLLNNVSNLSLVSIKTKGNAIIVNVVEKEESKTKFQPFYAPYNMVIKEIELISGTLNVGKDSVVRKGKVLVEPYTINSNGERIEVEAKANIVADVWFCGSITQDKEIIKYNRTGNKKVCSKVFYGNDKKNNFSSPYVNFETENINCNLTNKYFLPIFIQKTIFYETEKVIESFNFEENKTRLLEESKQKAYEILPNNVIINETIENITELDKKYIFQTYLKTTMEITNEN